MIDCITLAQGAHELSRATKTFGIDQHTGGLEETSPYRVGKYITSDTLEVENLRDLWWVLTRARHNPRTFVMRGVPTEYTPTWLAHRRLAYRQPVSKTDPSQGEEGPYYRQTDHHWFMVDIDGLVFDGDPMRQTLHGLPVGVWLVLDHLPAYLRGRGMIIQWSASAGIKPGIRLHLWFWSSRPVCCDSLRAWADGICDVAPFNPVQPHYIADPLFNIGASDPLGCRWQYVPGPPVEMPATVRDRRGHHAAQELARRERLHAAKVSRARAMLTGRTVGRELHERYALAALRDACAKILEAPVGARHAMIASQSLSTAALVLAGVLPEPVWRNDLTSAGEAAVGERRARDGEIKRLLDGALDRAEPANLDHVGGQRREVNQ